MSTQPDPSTGRSLSPLEMSAAEFRSIGHRLVDRLAEFLESLPARPVTRGESPAQVRGALRPGPLPDRGEAADALIVAATDLVLEHSLFNGHPRFFGFITSSAAPIGAFADLIASTVNPNVGGWILSPVASEIERECVRWIAELIGFPDRAGGLLVSGGNVANFVGFWVGRRVRTPWDLRARGYDEAARPVRVYASAETHTWIQKATDLSGMGTDAIRWIPTDPALRMDTTALRRRIEADVAAGDLPLLVVGTAGSVSTGAIDPLHEIAAICREHGLWFHVDGAYGAPAAALPEADESLKALRLADSVAIDPHKWLYAPLEAGCALVRDPNHLRDTFSYSPPYYPDAGETSDEAPIFYHEYGPQNSRGFRALKVWLGLRQAGRDGCIATIRDDIRIARRMHERALAHPEIEAGTHGLSIATFRYVPPDLAGDTGADAYLDRLNREILERLQRGGEAFPSNAVVGGRYLIRACVVNFRTQPEDADALIDIVVRVGREADAEMRGSEGVEGRVDGEGG